MGESLTVQVSATPVQIRDNHVLEIQFNKDPGFNFLKTQIHKDPDLNFFNSECIHCDLPWMVRDACPPNRHDHDNHYHNVPRSDDFLNVSGHDDRYGHDDNDVDHVS